MEGPLKLGWPGRPLWGGNIWAETTIPRPGKKRLGERYSKQREKYKGS